MLRSVATTTILIIIALQPLILVLSPFLAVKPLAAPVISAPLSSNNQLAELSSKLEHIFTSPVQAFFLEGEQLAELADRLTLRMFLANGAVDQVTIEVSDDHYGQDAESHEKDHHSGTSILYYRSQRIARLEIIGPSDTKLAIKVMPVTSAIEKKVQVSSSPESVQLKKTMFSNMGLQLTTREEWGAPATSLWTPSIALVNKIIIHHTASGIDNNDPANVVRAIYNSHYYRCNNNSGSYDPNNPDCDEENELWRDIGYNYLIDQFGNIYEGRAGGNGAVGAHSPPNTGTIGISMIGTYSSVLPTAAALDSLAKLVGRLAKLNQVGIEWEQTIFGHRHRQNTACPGQALFNYLPTLVERARNEQDTYSEYNRVMDKIGLLVNGRTLARPTPDEAQLLIKTSTIGDTLKQQVLASTPTASNFIESGGYLRFQVAETHLKITLTEIMLKSPETMIQPSYAYRMQSWDNNSATRALPSDYDATVHWNLEKIKLPEAWKLLGGCVGDALCGGNSSIVVAVVDTGVAYENFDYDAGGSYQLTDIGGLNMEVPQASANAIYHEGYDRRYYRSPELASTNFTTGRDIAQEYLCQLRDLAGSPCNAAEQAKVNHANDDYGHGTAVTTIIAGNTGDNAPNKLVGIAHNVTIMPIRIFFPNDSSMCYDISGVNDPSCSSSNSSYSLRNISTSYLVAQGIDWAVANGANVINLSLSGSGSDPIVAAAITNAYQNNVTVVAAAGNNGADVTNFFPANSPEAITVGATKSDDSRATYSNYGTLLDLVAPVGESAPRQAVRTFTCNLTDVCFRETAPLTDFSQFTSDSSPHTSVGTSLAAPQVSGAAALLLSYNSELTASDIANILGAGATDLGGAGFDNTTGRGLLNIYSSLVSTWRQNWSISRAADSSQVFQARLGGKVFQSVVDDGLVWTRIYDSSWSEWSASGGTNGDVYMASTSDKLFQSLTAGGYVYTRIYDGNSWSQWVMSGATLGRVNMASLGNNLVQSVMADGFVYTRVHDGNNWTVWSLSGATRGEVYMQATGSKLFQSVVANGLVWTRIYDGGSWSEWTMSGGTQGEVFMAARANLLYQSVTAGGYVYTRIHDNTSWGGWILSGGTAGKVYMQSSSNKLAQSVVAGSYVYSRIHDGNSWTNWTLSGSTPSEVYMGSVGQRIMQTVVAGGYVYTRVYDGNSWYEWVLSGAVANGKAITFISDPSGSLYQSLISSNGNAYTRIF